MDKKYIEVDGTYYSEGTNKRIIEILERARIFNQKIRVFYGDITTGRCWNDEFDTMGTIGRSSGTIKIPLLIKNSRSSGGGGILDNCIVRITIDKKNVYKHKNFHQGMFTMQEVNDGELLQNGYTHEVLNDGNTHARFTSEDKAKRYIDFMLGNSNRK